MSISSVLDMFQHSSRPFGASIAAVLLTSLLNGCASTSDKQIFEEDSELATALSILETREQIQRNENTKLENEQDFAVLFSLSKAETLRDDIFYQRFILASLANKNNNIADLALKTANSQGFSFDIPLSLEVKELIKQMNDIFGKNRVDAAQELLFIHSGIDGKRKYPKLGELPTDIVNQELAAVGINITDVHDISDKYSHAGVFTCKGDLSVYVDDATGRTTVNFGECGFN